MQTQLGLIRACVVFVHCLALTVLLVTFTTGCGAATSEPPPADTQQDPEDTAHDPSLGSTEPSSSAKPPLPDSETTAIEGSDASSERFPFEADASAMDASAEEGDATVPVADAGLPVADASGPDADLSCRHGAGGDWVCVSKPKGLAYASGPCAFTPEGDLWVNYRTTGTDVDSHIVKIDPDGNVLVHRTTSGGVGVNVNTLTAIDMIATKDGGIVWGGQDCVGERPVYCQDGLIVRLDREGNEINEWRYGTPGVIDRIWGLAPAPNDDFYAIGVGFFARMNLDFEIIWDRSSDVGDTGGGAHRIASNDAGMVVVGTMFGYLDADGEPLSEFTIPHGNDHYAVTEQGEVVSGAGFIWSLELGLWDQVLPQQAHRIRTGRGSFVGTSRFREEVTEVSYAGEVLRRHLVPGSFTNWYTGGACLSPDGSIAVSGDAVEDTDFGILDDEIEIDPEGEGSRAFVLYLDDFVTSTNLGAELSPDTLPARNP